MYLYNFYNIFIQLLLIIIVVVVVVVAEFDEPGYCPVTNDDSSLDKCAENKYLSSNKRYILYDVNPPEGFNLRRDVYVRVAVFINKLNKSDDKFKWILVLPPWGKSYHWRSQNIGDQSKIPWSQFFDTKSLNKFIPVIEMYEFLKEYKSENQVTILDRIYYLQNDPKMFENGDFHERNIIEKCIDNRSGYRKNYNDKFIGNFWGYQNISADKFDCVTFHGTMSGLKKNLQPDLYRCFMFDHMEIPLHDEYGSKYYWQARRSMRYNKYLIKITKSYREKYLNSTDDNDNTRRPSNWQDEKEHRNSIGGPYLAAHLRRRDFVNGHSNYVPSINNAASQLDEKMKKFNLKNIFIATDADSQEFDKLKNYLSKYNVFKYTPTTDELKKIKDGGVAIVDQIISSHARYFVGTQESTFTFRIQEEREIIGFPTSTTFNTFCGDKNYKKNCKPDSQWKIKW